MRINIYVDARFWAAEASQAMILTILGAQKLIFFDTKWCGSIFQILVPTEGGEHFFKQNMKNNACRGKLEQESIR